MYALCLLSVSFYGQMVCNASGDVFVFTSYDGGNLTIDVDMNIAGIKIGVRSYERTSVTIVGTYSANVDTIIIRGFNSGNNHCPPAVTTNTVVQAAPATVKIYNNGSFSPYYNYTCSGLTATSSILSFFTNGSASRLRGYTGFYGCWCNPQKLSISAMYCCKGAYSCFTALPLTLIDFNAFKKSATTTQLTWRVEDEAELMHYDVQYSENAEQFITFYTETVKVQNASPAVYSVAHTHFFAGDKNRYYRLKYNYANGAHTYSNIITETDVSEQLPVLVNTYTSKMLNFTGIIGDQAFEVSNYAHQLCLKSTLSADRPFVNVEQLPSGFYFIKHLASGQFYKFIKE